MLDEARLSGRLFEEAVETLYRDNRFMRGVLRVGERRAGPDGLAAPLLAVVHPRSRVVPLTSVLPFLQAARSAEKVLVRYEAETGTSPQHIGVLVGPRAHRTVWPRIFEWIDERR